MWFQPAMLERSPSIQVRKFETLDEFAALNDRRHRIRSKRIDGGNRPARFSECPIQLQ
jgi:hypothetical protein